MPPLGGGQGPCPAVSEPISFHGSSLICWIWYWPKHTATVHTLPKYTFSLYLALHYIHLICAKWSSRSKNRWNEKEKKVETKMSKFTRTETFTELYDQSVNMYVFVCACFVCLDRCTDPSLGFCQSSKWVLMWNRFMGHVLSACALAPIHQAQLCTLSPYTDSTLNSLH